MLFLCFHFTHYIVILSNIRTKLSTTIVETKNYRAFTCVYNLGIEFQLCKFQGSETLLPNDNILFLTSKFSSIFMLFEALPCYEESTIIICHTLKKLQG